MYIKITDGDIVDYKGEHEDIIVDGVSIKGLAKSEEDRVAYMPTAELIMDTSDKLISIPFTNYKLIGAIVEQYTSMRQMIYTTNNIAYLQDIETLNKKIDALAEQSHTNDIQTVCLQDEMREEFVAVDEVNNVLTNYVQTKDLPNCYTKTESDDKYLQKNWKPNV